MQRPLESLAALRPAALIAVIPGDPKPKRRPRVVRHGNKTWGVTPADTVQAERALRGYVCRWHDAPPCAGPVAVVLRFHRRTKLRVDLDNLAKLVLDAMNGVLWVDDSQIVALWLELHHSPDAPRTEMFVFCTAPGTPTETVVGIVGALFKR